MSAPSPFDVCGPLPTGVTVLESSAGTGKTFTIAALTARYVAEGVPLDKLLLVTFTRMATSELRERVRERLVLTEAGLAAPGVVAADDDVVRLLASGSAEEVERRRRRLAAAVAEFDAATIATTHQFCNHILDGLGVAGDVERDVAFLDDVRDLVEEVVDDLYVRRFLREHDPKFGRDHALRIGQLVVANPGAVLRPDKEGTQRWAMRRRLADAVCEEVERRKRRLKILTFDDLLTRLHATLADGDAGPAACARLRERYAVALVDEFQDTDPVQWDILRLAFGQGDSTLVLIGDPKQAIYAFRGADVYAYLEAADVAGERATLSVNWRSDQRLVDAHDALFGGVRLGHPGIAYQPVKAAPGNQEPGLVGAHVDSPLRVRVVHRSHQMVRLTGTGWVNKPSGQLHVAGDLAVDVVDLLDSDARLVGEGDRPISPGDIAVLVRTHRQAGEVRDALEDVGVPAVINGAGSVFGTAVAREWLVLLEALERPALPTRARSVALTSFVGWTPAEVDVADDAAWEQLHDRLHQWAAVLRRRGVATLAELVTRTEGLPGRLLQRVDGERLLTDLRHVGQLLHAEATAQSLGVTALAAWLRDRIAEAGEDVGAEDRSRRLESDAQAVQVLTIHRSKGLEFPVVYCPYLWVPHWFADDEPAIFHDPDNDDRRTINVGLGGPGFSKDHKRHREEQLGEDLRLAYVALTRARHQAVVWWAAGWNSGISPLGRLLFAREPGGDVEPEAVVPEDDEVAGMVAALAAHAGADVSVETTVDPITAGRRWSPPPTDESALEARRFSRDLDVAWRRTSYSGITAAAHEAAYAAGATAAVEDEARVASEPEVPAVVDEELPPIHPAAGPVDDDAGVDDEVDEEERRLRAVPTLLAGLAGGARTGSLVHEILEHTDFAAADLLSELTGAVARHWTGRGLPDGSPAELVAGLAAFVETPLGPLAGGARLRDVARRDRLDELDFELPLAGGDTPRGDVTVAAIAGLIRSHLRDGDVLAPYADALDDELLAGEIRGFLSGSIDLVLRLHDLQGDPRFYVVDYKTNWLAEGDAEPTAWHYRPPALADAMIRAHYPLQALLYAAALHRYLRWRLPGYAPDRHLGGVLYLFVRGMVGDATPVVDGHPCGVFSWPFPKGLVPALSDLLDTGMAEVETDD